MSTQRPPSPEAAANLLKAEKRLYDAQQMLAKARAAGFAIEEAESIVKEQQDRIQAIRREFMTPHNDTIAHPGGYK